MFKDWEDCERMSTGAQSTGLSKEEIPRHYRAMANSVLFQRSRNEHVIITEDPEMPPFVKRWDITSMSVLEMDAASTKARQRYHREIKDYEARKRTAVMTQSQRQLWRPSK